MFFRRANDPFMRCVSPGHDRRKGNAGRLGQLADRVALPLSCLAYVPIELVNCLLVEYIGFAIDLWQQFCDRVISGDPGADFFLRI